MHFSDVTFEREDVRLDGRHFTRCLFADCRLLFGGDALPVFTECDVGEDTQFVLTDSARRTFQFLSALYHHSGKGGRETVERLLEQLRSGTLE